MWTFKSISLTVIVLFFSVQNLNAQELKKVTFEELPTLQAQENRPVLVFLTADWCMYCKRVKHTAFEQNDIIASLNKDFYFIEFDGENKKPVTFLGQVYEYKPTGPNTGTHELAALLATENGELSYPTFLILNAKFELLYRYAGYMKTSEIRELLTLVKKHEVQ